MSTKRSVPLIDCYKNALDDEEMFILLARDECAPIAIEAWAYERIRLGLNERDDQQINEALNCAAKMRAQRVKVREELKLKREREEKLLSKERA